MATWTSNDALTSSEEKVNSQASPKGEVSNTLGRDKVFLEIRKSLFQDIHNTSIHTITLSHSLPAFPPKLALANKRQIPYY